MERRGEGSIALAHLPELGLVARDRGTTRARGSALALGALLMLACSASGETAPDPSGHGGSGQGGSLGSGGAFGEGGGGPSPGDCAAAAKLIYLVSYERDFFSFDPTVNGLAAYKKIGTLGCASTGSPQSMSVDRGGTASVFYDSGELFHVSTYDASCTPTSYTHPVTNAFNQLGMGFTATEPDSSAQTLYVISPDFGLATIDLVSLAVQQKGVFAGTAAELTGGADARLFMFAAGTASLSEIDVATFGASPMHTFSELAGTMAWAFARYAGTFYMFTSPGVGVTSRTTTLDPEADVTAVRDADIGITVVGAGQSTCVPGPPPK